MRDIFRVSEEQMASSTSCDGLYCIREPAKLQLHKGQRVLTAMLRVDVQCYQPGDFAGDNSYICIRPFPPPFPDDCFISGGYLLPFGQDRVFSPAVAGAFEFSATAFTLLEQPSPSRLIRRASGQGLFEGMLHGCFGKRLGKGGPESVCLAV